MGTIAQAKKVKRFHDSRKKALYNMIIFNVYVFHLYFLEAKHVFGVHVAKIEKRTVSV